MLYRMKQSEVIKIVTDKCKDKIINLSEVISKTKTRLL